MTRGGWNSMAMEGFELDKPTRASPSLLVTQARRGRFALGDDDRVPPPLQPPSLTLGDRGRSRRSPPLSPMSPRRPATARAWRRIAASGDSESGDERGGRAATVPMSAVRRLTRARWAWISASASPLSLGGRRTRGGGIIGGPGSGRRPLLLLCPDVAAAATRSGSCEKRHLSPKVQSPRANWPQTWGCPSRLGAPRRAKVDATSSES